MNTILGKSNTWKKSRRSVRWQWNSGNDACGEDLQTTEHILRVHFPYPPGGNKWASL